MMDYATLVLLSALFLGWGAGANDAANAVGCALGAKTVSYRKGILLVVVFSMLGFLLQGEYVSTTVGQKIIPNEIFSLNTSSLLAALIAAGIVTFIATAYSLPISISHTLVGSIIGIAFAMEARGSINYDLLSLIAACWVATPVIALTLTVFFHKLVVTPLASRMDLITFSRAFKFLSIASVAVVSYSLGASAISTIVGPISGFNSNGMESFLGPLIALAFGLGVVMFGQNVIRTLGSKITLLGPSTAFSAQFSAALTVYGFTLMGLPSSVTHAVVGSVAGIGLLKGIRTLNRKTMTSIVLGWIVTPLISGLLAMAFYRLL